MAALPSRRRVIHSLVKQRAFLAVLAVVIAAFIYLTISPDHWRRGSIVIGFAMLLAGVLRAALPETEVGLLAVRGRWRDALIYLALGAVIVEVVIRLG
jgi:hypothetical protein